MTEICSDLDCERTVVTGGAGFIGSHLVERLLSEGCEVTAYDNFDDFYLRKEENLSSSLPNRRFSLVHASILDYDSLKKSIAGSQLVFHLAAQPGVGFSFQNPTKTNLVNTEGTLNVIRACIEQKTERLIFASSSSVYGAPVKTPVDERHPTNPLSVYGTSKLAAENYCLIYHNLQSLHVVCLRYHTVYGPRQRPDMAIYKWSKALLSKQAPVVYGDGSQARDFTFVDDIVNGTVLAAESGSAIGEVFNLASGNSITVNQTLGELQKVLGDEAIRIAYESAKPWDPQVTHADISKAKRMLNYHPKTTLEDGLRRFSQWMAGHLKANEITGFPSQSDLSTGVRC